MLYIRPIRIIVFLFVFSLLACQQEQQQFQPPPPEVTIASPLIKEVTEWDDYTGRLQAVEFVEIRARVDGYLKELHFNDGQIVNKGDLLFVIDPRPYQATLDESKADLTRANTRLKLAKNDLERAQRLFKSRAISEEELDQRQQEKQGAIADVQAAQAAVRSAELNVEFTHVRAPITGRIGRNLVDIGNLVSGGSANSSLLATLVSLDPIHVYVTADEQAYLKYVRLDRAGSRPSSRDTPNPIYLGLADEEGFPHKGHMDFVDNRIDPATGTMQARAIFPNPDYVLTPGLFARVRLLGKGPYEAMLIPDEAILADQSKKFVYVLGENNLAKRKVVELGRRIEGLRSVLKGLEPSDKIIISGVQRVRTEAPVTPKQGEIIANAEPLGLAVNVSEPE